MKIEENEELTGNMQLPNKCYFSLLQLITW